jgi:hypothetical protein
MGCKVLSEGCLVPGGVAIVVVAVVDVELLMLRFVERSKPVFMYHREVSRGLDADGAIVIPTLSGNTQAFSQERCTCIDHQYHRYCRQITDSKRVYRYPVKYAGVVLDRCTMGSPWTSAQCGSRTKYIAVSGVGEGRMPLAFDGVAEVKLRFTLAGMQSLHCAYMC